MLSYYKIYKPYGMLSQFTDSEKRPTLASLLTFPPDVYPVGRLDKDSEGLLILTNDKSLTGFLLNPESRSEKEYYVQVEGVPGEEELKLLRKGVVIEGHRTLPAEVKLIDTPVLPARVPPIRERKNIPVTWLSIILHEGRNRQVRKMTAAVGFPALRLVRVRINRLHIGDMQPGETSELNSKQLTLLRKK